MSISISAHVLPFVGIELRGLNLANNITSEDLTLLHEYYNQYHLLIIRDQNLTEPQLVQTSHHFGEPVPALVPTYRLEKYPVITRHTNAKDRNNQSIGVVAPEFVFHSDSYFSHNPSKTTLLYSLISPNSGGETHFVDMCFAYEALSESIKDFIQNKNAIYKNAYINQPSVIHPLVRVHTVTTTHVVVGGGGGGGVVEGGGGGGGGFCV